MELQRVSNEILGGQGSPFSIRIIAPVIQLNQSIARLKAQFTEQLSAIDRILVSDDVPWLRYLQGQISADSELKRFFTTERESHRAAAAILLVGGSLGKYCGISGRIRAQRSSAVAFVQVDCSEANYDLLHELGHLLGARHEWGDQERQNCEKRSATTNLVKENVTDIDSDCEQDYQDVKELRLESIDKATNRAFVQVDDWAQQPYGTIMSANSETKLFYGPTNPPVDRRPYWSSTSAKFVRGVRVSSGKEDNLAAIHKYAKCLADFAGPGPFPEDNAEKICLKVSVPPPASPVPHENCVATNTCQDDIGGLNKLIYFATDQIGFGDVYKAEVDRLAGSLFSQNVPHVYVEGFADSQIVNSKGEEQYNCLLSRERAAAVAHYVHGVFEKLVKDGTPAPTVSCRWWGSKLPTHAMLANSKDAHNRHAKISWNTICDKAASDGRILCDEDFHECPIPSDKWRDELVSTSEDWRLKCRL
jgi:outer membrane protein OmpA-like peptidoglycan-associated protein